MYDDVGRAFSQNGEIEKASRCYTDATVSFMRWGQEAYKCSGRCSGAGVGWTEGFPYCGML